MSKAMIQLKPVQTGIPMFSGLLTTQASSGTVRHAVQAAGMPAAWLTESAQPGHSQPPRGSARRKLWDLSTSAACPVTGVCLRFADLYKLARKAGLPVTGASEYEVHVRVVGECRRRSDMAERIQRELDARYALCVKTSVQKIKTTEELARWWDQACIGTDWAGVFWAVLTHPRCTPELENIVLGQVHMLQHQVGMASRVDHTRLHEVLDENLRLGEELDLTQQRLQAARHTHAQELAQSQAEVMLMRGEVIRAQTERDQALAQWQTLKASEPLLLNRQKLATDNAELLEHNRQLRRALAQAELALTRFARQPLTAAEATASLAGAGRGTAPMQMDHGTSLLTAPAVERTACDQPMVPLADRAVLCVGGRTAGIPVYREVIEHRGGRFLHHDGGDEDRLAQLGGHLQAADVVICQVGCISHNAYWRVKDHCKRTGKPCLFVESSSRSALERALGQADTTDI